MSNLSQILTDDSLSKETSEETIMKFIDDISHGNVFKEICQFYQKKDQQNLEKIKSIFFDTAKFSEESKIKMLVYYFDFLKISVKFKKPYEQDTEPLYMTRSECLQFACYCITDLFYGTSYMKLIFKKALTPVKSGGTYAERMVRDKLIPFIIFLPRDSWSSSEWSNDIGRISDVLFLLLNNADTEGALCRYIERDIIGVSNIERKMLNEMSVVTDMTKLTLYFNTIHILFDLWNIYMGDVSNPEYDNKLLSIGLEYPRTNKCHLTYYELKKYEDDDEANGQNIEFQDKIFYMLHKLIENIYLTTKNKHSVIETEMENLKKHIEKLDKQQAEKFEPQREIQKQLIRQRIARLAPHVYTFADYLTFNNINNKLGIFYNKSSKWISNKLENVYVNNTEYIPIMENIIGNFSDFMGQQIKYLDISLDNTIATSKTIIANKNYVKNPFIKIRCLDNLFDFVFSNPRGLEYVFEESFRINLINSLMTYYVELEFNNSNLYYYKFGTRFHILHLILFLKDMHFEYTQDIISAKFINTELYNKFIYMLLSDFNYLLNEGLSNLSEIKKTEAVMEQAEQENNVEDNDDAENEVGEENQENQQLPGVVQDLLNVVQNNGEEGINNVNQILNMMFGGIAGDMPAENIEIVFNNMVNGQNAPVENEAMDVEPEVVADMDVDIPINHDYAEFLDENIVNNDNDEFAEPGEMIIEEPAVVVEEPIIIENVVIEEEPEVAEDELLNDDDEEPIISEEEIMEEEIMEDEDDIIDEEEIMNDELVDEEAADGLINIVDGNQDANEVNLVENIRRVNRLTSIVNNDFNYIGELFQLFFLLLGQDKEAFLTEDICNHLIEILNYYLVKLAKQTPETLEEDEEKYNYNPYKILQCIAQLYYGLASEEVFLKLMVSNIESFSVENINIMMDKLQNMGMISDVEINGLKTMLKNINQIRSTQELNILDKLDELDVLPSEFYDPIFSIPIKNPIALPTSHYIVERKSIMRHLISNQFDPTNRKSLTKDELEEYNGLGDTQKTVVEFVRKRDDWISDYLNKNQDKTENNEQ